MRLAASHFALLLSPLAVSRAQSPAAVIRVATQAVEGDSVAAVSARWRARADESALLGLATIARLTYHGAEARGSYRRLIDSAARDVDPHFAVYAMVGLGRLEQISADYVAAESLFSRAILVGASLGDSTAAARALVYLASIRARSRGPLSALPLIDSARALIPAADTATRMLWRCARATMRTRLGADGTELDARAAADTARAIGERRIAGRCVLAVAAAQAQRSYERASVTIASAIVLFRMTHDATDLAVALQFDAYYQIELMQLWRARQLLDEAVALARSSDDQEVIAWALQTSGIVALQASDHAAAARAERVADSLFIAHGDVWGDHTTRAVLGAIALEQGDTAAARSAYLTTLAWARAGGQRESIAASLGALGRIALAGGRYAEATSYFDSALAISGQHGAARWPYGYAWERGYILLAQGHPVAAERWLHTALNAESPGLFLRIAELRELLALARLRQGDTADAARTLRRAGDELDSARAAIGERELRELVFQSRNGLNAPHFGSATVIAGVAGAGDVGAAFDLAERRRARELGDAMTRLSTLSGGMPAPSPGQALSGRSRVATFADVQRGLPDDRTALLEFVTAPLGEPSTLFVVTRRDARAYILPGADSLTAPVERFATLLESHEDSRRLAAALGGALLDSAFAGLSRPVDRLVIVPDGPLHHLPFDALLVPDQDRVGRALLATRVAIAMEPSATILLALRARPPSTADGILAMGDPDFSALGGDSTLGLERRAAFVAAGGLDRLPASGQEARLVARFSPRSVLLVRRDASAHYLLHSPLSAFRVIHLATHALVNEDVPQLTALALAPTADDDGFLGAADLAGLHLDADLIVLSGCRTAGGTVERGEGIRGLTAPLLQAGARAILATRWRISDTSTMNFVDDFYRALAAGRDEGDALRTAKEHALARGEPAGAWAAFTLVGDPTVKVPVEVPAARRPWLIGVLLLCALIAYLLRGRIAIGAERRRTPSTSKADTVQR